MQPLESFMPISCVMHRMNLKFNRWIPHELIQADKDKRLRACSNLLEYQSKNKILDRIVYCNEKWIYFNNTGRKESSSAPCEPFGNVAKHNLTKKKEEEEEAFYLVGLLVLSTKIIWKRVKPLTVAYHLEETMKSLELQITAITLVF
ncbi:Mariner Mos1 transposase, partial [Stegodyphus mimosarum]